MNNFSELSLLQTLRLKEILLPWKNESLTYLKKDESQRHKSRFVSVLPFLCIGVLESSYVFVTLSSSCDSVTLDVAWR